MIRRLLPSALTVALATTALAVPAYAQTSSPVVINEVESNGDAVGDWVELANTNHNESIDISGWSILDNDDKHEAIVIPEGTTIESGGYFSIYTESDDYPDGGFGLGGKDSARVYNAEGELVDETTWDGHAATTWGRIPDMTGEFAETGESTRNAKNIAAGQTEPVADEAWPFDPQTIRNLDLGPEFQVEDMSGIDFDANGRAWIVNNDEGGLFALDYKNGQYSVAGSWNLKYQDGTGLPDTEGITVTEDGLYVATERNNADKNTSRPSVLRFDIPTGEGDLSATNEWNLGSFLPEDLGANAGLEAISAVPGGFAVGVEGTGEVLFVNLDGEQATLEQRYQSPFVGVMALDYNGSQLRVMCDEACEGASIVLEKKAQWEEATGIQARPEGMENFANEGYASYTANGCTRFLWADDGVSNGTSLRAAGCEETPDQSPAGSSHSDILTWLITLLSVLGGIAHWFAVKNF